MEVEPPIVSIVQVTVDQCLDLWNQHAVKIPEKGDRLLLDKKSAIKCALMLIQEIKIQNVDNGFIEDILETVCTIFGYLNYEQFLVFIYKVSNLLDIQVDDKYSMAPHSPETCMCL